MRGLRKDNKGYSLVELIIVVAIIAVIGLGATWSIILVFSANAKTCSNDIVNAISECKIMTMTKGQGNVRLLLYRDGENGTIYSKLQTKESPTAEWEDSKDGRQKIGASRCSVTKIEDDGVTETPIPTSEGTAWEIYFDRSSGKLMDDKSTVDKIHVLGGRKSYRIGIEKLTGKVTKELQ